MRIVSIQLKNIKSHRDTELTFAPGINVLSGANGSGKSTIFQAIGYALFGVSAQDFVSRADRFLTIGAKKGEVSVVFEPAPGELYRVTRTVGSAGKWLLAKENGGSFEIEEHANAQETEQRIATLLGLSGGRPLSEQFKLVIGPFQNDFLGPFVISQPTKRQTAFDEILGIDAWRKTIEGTRSLNSTINAKTETLQAEVAGKVEQVAVLPEKETELGAMRQSVEAKKGELAQRLADLQRVTALLASLDARKERIDAIQAEIRGLEERSASGKDHVANQQLLVDQATAAAAVVSASAPGKKGYDAAEERLKKLRQDEQQKQTLEKKLADLEKEQASLRSALEIEVRELADLSRSMEDDAERLDEEEKALRKTVAEVKAAESLAAANLAAATASQLRFRELPMHRLETTFPYLFVALDAMAAIDAEAEEKKGLLVGKGALTKEAAALAELQLQLERVQGARAELSGRKLALVEGREKIGAGDCPFFHEPCRNLQGGDGVDVFTERIALLDAEMARLDEEAAVAAAKAASAQQAAREVAALEQVVLELEKGARERARREEDFSGSFKDVSAAALIPPLEDWLSSAGLAGVAADLGAVRFAPEGSPLERRRQLTDAGDAWTGIIARLEDAVLSQVRQAEQPVKECAVRLAELAARGEALEAKRRELALAKQRADKRKETISEQEKRAGALSEAIALRKEEISRFAGTDEAIREASGEMAAFQPARDSFIANEKAAEELEKRRETLAKFQARLGEIGAAVAAGREELAGVVAEYDADGHEGARRERDLLLSAEATLKAELVSLAADIARLEKETAALRVIAEEIAVKEAAIEKLKEHGALVKFLRNQVFKNVSSQLSERFREEISFRADRIYRCICNSDEELLWGENYQVVLKDMVDGEMRERTDDQLSGGQMMSAVVALRLALLQTIGARIAFFDEPTSNLDAERRENLAKAFRAIDVGQEEVTEHWYDQLFLVSHDVSFTEITDQTIQLD